MYYLILELLLRYARFYLFTLLQYNTALWFFISFRKKISDNTRVRIIIVLLPKARIFFKKFNIRLYDKNSESDFFFFLHQNQIIFFRKKTYSPPPPSPPFKLNGRSLSINSNLRLCYSGEVRCDII